MHGSRLNCEQLEVGKVGLPPLFAAHDWSGATKSGGKPTFPTSNYSKELPEVTVQRSVLKLTIYRGFQSFWAPFHRGVPEVEPKL